MSELRRELGRDALQLVEWYWDHFLRLNPLFATQVGDERFDGLLPDLGDEARSNGYQIHKEVLDLTRHLERASLDFETRAALELIEAIAQRELDFIRYRFDRFWVVSHMMGSIYLGPGLLLSAISELQRADTAARRERYLHRLAAIPDYLEAAKSIMREAVAEGQVVPTIVAERTLAQVERLLAAPPEESPALRLVPPDRVEDRQLVADMLRERVYPAYAAYREGLLTYRSRARDSIGLSALPDGESMYAAEILGWTTLALKANEIHELGLVELKVIQEERSRIAQRLGHAQPADAIAAHEATGRNTLHSRDEILQLARDQVRRAWEVAPRFFGRLPQRNCEVRAVDESIEDDVMDYYIGPSGDGSRPGVFHVNTRPRPLHSLASTTYHESNPGHHFQTALDQETPGRPAIRRFGNELQGVAFGEGWGLYSERLADEMGLYQNDYERLGMLELQALRAARLVVDTGIHAFGWSREQAIAVMRETDLPDWKVAAEVDRYIAMAGQALCYKIGQMEIEGLRREAAEREGSRFSLRNFHDRLLSLGALPLSAVRREMKSHS